MHSKTESKDCDKTTLPSIFAKNNSISYPPQPHLHSKSLSVDNYNQDFSNLKIGLKYPNSHVRHHTKEVPLQYLWLLETTNRMGDFNKSPISNVGPGSYNISPSKNTKGAKFPTRSRFQKETPGASEVGPGEYNPPRVHLVGGAIDRSTSKTYIGEIIDKNLKNPTPSPGWYQVESPRRSPYNEGPHTREFKSKIDRFKIGSNERLPPGIYNQQGSFERQIRMICESKKAEKHIKGIGTMSLLKKRKSHKEKRPGPGEYENINTLTKYLKKKLDKGYKGNFGKKEMRFKQEGVNSCAPGPGHYLRSLNSVEASLLPSPHPSANFICHGSYQRGRQGTTPFGEYDLSSFNMAYSLQKKKEYIDKLKTIDVELPGFGSRVERSPKA